MAIADRNTSMGDAQSATSVTYAHSVLGTTDLCLLVYCDDWRSGGSSDPTGITYAAAAMTKIGNHAGGPANDNLGSMWVKTAPATGSNNVIVTHSAAHDITSVSISYSGVDQTTPTDTVQVNDTTSTTPSHSVASETGDMVVSYVGWYNGTAASATGGLTERDENNNGAILNSITVADAPGAATVTASWSITGTTDIHGEESVNLNQAAAVAAQYARPASDANVGTWTTDTGGTTNLYAAIDESTANDADYIQSEVGG